jgi:hypothetical protein
MSLVTYYRLARYLILTLEIPALIPTTSSQTAENLIDKYHSTQKLAVIQIYCQKMSSSFCNSWNLRHSAFVKLIRIIQIIHGSNMTRRDAVWISL